MSRNSRKDAAEAKASWPPRHQEAAVASLLRMVVILAHTSLLLNTLSEKKNDLMK